MAELWAETVAITEATAVDVECPTTPDTRVSVTNIGANPVWIQHNRAVGAPAASATGANCEVVLAGATTYLMWLPAGETWSMRAQTGDSSVVIVNAGGRG